MPRILPQVHRRTALGAVGAALAVAALPAAASAGVLPKDVLGVLALPVQRPERARGGPSAVQQSQGRTANGAPIARAPDAVSPACGPQLTITVAYAFGLTGSPEFARHTHAFSVTLTSGILADGQTVTVDGATSGVLEQFPQHTHRITNASGVLGASCSFVTDTGNHTFTLHASDFIVPS